MNINPNWVSAAADCITAATVFFVYKQFKGDHERSRRQLSVELMEGWVRNLSQHSTAARKLVDKFSSEQAISLYAQEPFAVDGRYVPLLDAALKDRLEIHDSNYTLTVEQSSSLRWEIINYLNALEIVLSAWSHNIADREMIEEQFHDLVSPEKDVYLLKNFRIAAGGSSTYPCIEEFVRHLGAAKMPAKKGKDKIG